MKESLERIAGTIILYNSSIEVIDNIYTYIHDITTIYVIDNSDQSNNKLVNELCKFTKVKYHFNDGNKGIAYALNIAAQMAINDGFTYLLTMDDDSKAPLGMINAMQVFIKNYQNPSNIGIVSAVHTLKSEQKDYRKVYYTMTSGNLLNLNAYLKVGPFNESFFIDHVDHDYGIRLNAHGLDVIELIDQKLNHTLGKTKQIVILYYIKINYISHSPIRNYYFFRNGFKVISRYALPYPKIGLQLIFLLAKELIKVIIFEDMKVKRVILTWRGIKDALTGKMGEYTYVQD
ncbi:glycosyltransferase [Spirosoma areae]